MTQKYVAIITRQTQYRVVVEADTSKPYPQQILEQMEADGQDIEQYRVQAVSNVDPGEPYGSNTATMPPLFSTAAPNRQDWAMALPAESSETVDFVANVAI